MHGFVLFDFFQCLFVSSGGILVVLQRNLVIGTQFTLLNHLICSYIVMLVTQHRLYLNHL